MRLKDVQLLRIPVTGSRQSGFTNNETIHSPVSSFTQPQQFLHCDCHQSSYNPSAMQENIKTCYYVKADPLASLRRMDRISHFSIAHFWLWLAHGNN